MDLNLFIVVAGLNWVEIGHFSSELHIPSYAMSFCTYRMNFSHQFGCNSHPMGSTGPVLLVRSVDELQFKLSNHHGNKVILVIPGSILSKRVYHDDIYPKKNVIAGIIVFEPSYCIGELKSQCKNIIFNLSSFTEVEPCKDLYFRLFNQKFCKLQKRFDQTSLYEIEFPFPLVLLKHKYQYQENIINCFHTYNEIESKTSKCEMGIYTYTPSLKSSERCIKSQDMLTQRIWLTPSFKLCSDLSGFNIYITFNPSKYYLNKSVILIITKMDTVSIFDTAAAGTHEIYPTVTLLMYMATLFNSSSMPAHMDILLGFLDNESLDQSGSIRMIYDLKMNEISNGVGNISDKNIKLIISLDDFTDVNSKNLFLFLHNCETDAKDICGDFLSILTKSLGALQMDLFAYKLFDYKEIWSELVNVPIIYIKNTINNKANYKKSYFDRFTPDKVLFSMGLANNLVAACLQVLSSNSFLGDIKISLDPFKMAECFHNSDCDYLSKILGPNERDFYRHYGSPLVAQSFVDGFIENKQGMYKNRLSYFVMKMMIYYLHTSSRIDANCLDISHLNNFTIDINDIPTCFQALIQVRRNFNPLEYVKSRYSSHGISNFPIWMRVNLAQEMKVVLYISKNYELMTNIIITGTLITATSLVGSLLFYRNIDVIIPEDFL